MIDLAISFLVWHFFRPEVELVFEAAVSWFWAFLPFSWLLWVPSKNKAARLDGFIRIE